MTDVAGRSDLLDLTLCLHAITERAVRVSDTGEDAKAVWLPLSHCEIIKRPNRTCVVTLPEWLAHEKGLI